MSLEFSDATWFRYILSNQNKGTECIFVNIKICNTLKIILCSGQILVGSTRDMCLVCAKAMLKKEHVPFALGWNERFLKVWYYL